jgi:hypothetical protein
MRQCKISSKMTSRANCWRRSISQSLIVSAAGSHGGVDLWCCYRSGMIDMAVIGHGITKQKTLRKQSESN